jgi:hypothetical protein
VPGVWDARGQAGHRVRVAGQARPCAGEAIAVRSQTVEDQILPALARVRPVLGEVCVQAERTATEHEQMAAWYAKHGDHAAAGMERRAAAVQRQRLADLDAAFQALEEAVSAALNLDSYRDR